MTNHIKVLRTQQSVIEQIESVLNGPLSDSVRDETITSLKAARLEYQTLHDSLYEKTFDDGETQFWHLRADLDAMRTLARLNGADVREVLSRCGFNEKGRLVYAGLGRLNLTDLTPIAAIKGVSELNLEENKLKGTALSPLAELTRLRKLDLCGNQITDLAPLSNIVTLRSLQLGGNEICNLEVLGNMTELRFLNISGNGLRDIGTLPVLPNLRELLLEINHISKLERVLELPKLKRLSVMNNPLDDTAKLTLPELRSRGVRCEEGWID